MKDKKKLVEGDIFYININEAYIFGKILMDISARILKKEPHHCYWLWSDFFLVEVYKGIYDEPKLTSSEIIVPSSFVTKKCFNGTKYKSVNWFFYKNELIDYKKIDFPETLETGDNGFIDFRKCDVILPTKTLYRNFFPDILHQKYTGHGHFSYYSLVDDALHFQKRDDLLLTKDRTYFTKDEDLRLAEKDRIDFYNQINENPNMPYYELALKHGFDLGRFYE